ncbi:RNA ligase/cyclic nucleotide phosphodiesterase [Legionella busanensis]|uniref:RNA 2',3'-cyclic phosphodiesterase n=1 Tax=Legionella busanensis TaxID=190655 RepID=A0A378JMT6_9GAMM|nr:RNA 2',3'-cyclic phosphodiesterase [Legionella busanensis]STX52387.1 RNA ligase/cyclic nucleotide phosphodiesterase [Legionella busanensis]
MTQTTIRVFFAISLSTEILDAIAVVVDKLKQTLPQQKIRWTKLENLHITLRFLQSIQIGDLPKLIEQVELNLLNVSSFRLKFGELELFPKPKHPRLIALQAGPNEQLAPISYGLAKIIDTLNYPTEKRAFRGHITLGRLQNYQSTINLLPIRNDYFPRQLVQSVNLFESRLVEGQRQYNLIKRFSLGNN